MAQDNAGSATTPATTAASTAPANIADAPLGVWMPVTPVDFESREFGTQSVVADPVRPGEFYFVGDGGQGIWKSTDFGTTWTHIVPKGFIYMMTIDPNPRRDPKTPPTMWACAGYGKGVARSTDGGEHWSTFKVDNEVVKALGDHQRASDTYDIEVDPTDALHVLVSLHGVPGLSESHDGGATWSTVKAADDTLGTSLYVFFTDPSPAEAKAGATFSSTWLTISQMGGGGGCFRTSNGGATFTKINALQHGHGNAQAFTAGNGVVYMGGYAGDHGHGVYRSADFGITWEKVNDGTPQDGIYATPNFIYADNGWSTGGIQNQKLQRAPRAAGTLGTWVNYEPNAPMTNGSGHAAVSSYGKHAVIITACRKAGLWRFVEK